MSKGLIFAVLASLFFSLMNVFAKYLSAHSISIMEIAFYRGVIGVLITLMIIRIKKIELIVHNWPLLISRGLLGAISILFAFFTISKIALVEASFLAHLSPVITIFMAQAFLKEKLPKTAFIGITLAVIGAVFMTSPWNKNLRAIYVLIGILGAFFTSSASISIRQLSKDHEKYLIILAFLLTSALLPIPFIKWSTYQLPDGSVLWSVIGIGIISFFGQYFLTLAYKHEKAALVAATRYIGIVFSLFFGFFIWSEIPSASSTIGGGVIVLSCLLLTFPHWFFSQESK